MTSLFFDPWMAQRLWRRLFVGARQPLDLDFALDEIRIEGRPTPVVGRTTPLAPLARLREFSLRPEYEQAGRVLVAASSERRKIILVPPFSGGFSIMLRDVAAAFLPHADVAIIEWLNIGRALDATSHLDFDDQIGVILRAFRRVGKGAHALAVCQSGPPTLIATAAIGTESRDDATVAPPISLSLLSAPLQPLAAPSVVSENIRARSPDWYMRRLVSRVSPKTGVRRLVYPAEAQMSLMMSTLASQSPSRDELSRLISRDDGDAPHRLSFLEIVTALMDLPAEHFLSSLERIYLSEEGPIAPMQWRGRKISPNGLSSVALAAVEGENDRVAAPGQTWAVVEQTPAQTGVMRRRFLIPGLGHFGLFYGRGWREAVAPKIQQFMQEAEAAQQRRQEEQRQEERRWREKSQPTPFKDPAHARPLQAATG